jgi:hypothetical protein
MDVAGQRTKDHNVAGQPTKDYTGQHAKDKVAGQYAKDHYVAGQPTTVNNVEQPFADNSVGGQSITCFNASG